MSEKFSFRVWGKFAQGQTKKVRSILNIVKWLCITTIWKSASGYLHDVWIYYIDWKGKNSEMEAFITLPNIQADYSSFLLKIQTKCLSGIISC